MELNGLKGALKALGYAVVGLMGVAMLYAAVMALRYYGDIGV